MKRFKYSDNLIKLLKILDRGGQFDSKFPHLLVNLPERSKLQRASLFIISGAFL